MIFSKTGIGFSKEIKPAINWDDALKWEQWGSFTSATLFDIPQDFIVNNWLFFVPDYGSTEPTFPTYDSGLTQVTLSDGMVTAIQINDYAIANGIQCLSGNSGVMFRFWNKFPDRIGGLPLESGYSFGSLGNTERFPDCVFNAGGKRIAVMCTSYGYESFANYTVSASPADSLGYTLVTSRSVGTGQKFVVYAKLVDELGETQVYQGISRGTGYSGTRSHSCVFTIHHSQS